MLVPIQRDRRSAVLVTGGAGYIGSHAVLALLDAGHDVVVIDNLSSGFRWAVHPDATFYQGDVADSALLGRIFKEHRIAAVLHFAGSLIVSESVGNPLKYYHNNSETSRLLLSAMIDGGVRNIVFSSTAAVYGDGQHGLVEETSPTQPINPYGMSKLLTEAMIRDTARAHGMDYCILRYFNVAGADPDLRSGQSTIGATHLIKVAVEAALGRRSHVAVFGSDFPTRDGTGIRDYIHVSDLADAHVLALDHLLNHDGAALTLNCGYGTGYSVSEVLDSVDRVSGIRVPRRMEPRRSGDPASLVASNARIREALGWLPRHDCLDAIVQHALAWEQAMEARKVG
ncbi:UDP-glucose 4-epimerase GalE [Sphingomonas sanxanigenens]|uniref:UDP-glucose 4-epimerase n=1 Tax=Sphingomonas sanxanigenens DSM 19645 = NX02 TaxID=1123269 RepID=W0AHE1_9SPHN|nr:UDP-glucose 4-epimerase GalE [Sphingomonas sanxanigenens]AHE55045.1 hypothetical protein NX02_16835 [Sphingomonas sanxanigenens DSM 19645 = NX02]